MIKKLLFVLVVICCTNQLAHAATVTLAWDKNTESDLAGYKLHYGNTPRAQSAYTQSVTINNPAAVTHQLSLQSGVYYFALTAFDTGGNESGFSQEVTTSVPGIEPPGKPGQPRLVP